MAGPSRVDWTPEAEEQLSRIHRFVLDRWSEKIADRFLTLVMEFEDLVLQYPFGFQASQMHTELRMGLIHRNVKAIYRVDPERILIITLIDMRAENKNWI